MRQFRIQGAGLATPRSSEGLLPGSYKPVALSTGDTNSPGSELQLWRKKNNIGRLTLQELLLSYSEQDTVDWGQEQVGRTEQKIVLK